MHERSDAMLLRLRGPSRSTNVPMPLLLPSPSLHGKNTATVPEVPLKDGVSQAAVPQWNATGDDDYSGGGSFRQRSLTAVAGTPPESVAPAAAVLPPSSRSRHPSRPHSNEEVGRAAAVLSSLSSLPSGKARKPGGQNKAHRDDANNDITPPHEDNNNNDDDVDDADTDSPLQHGDAADGAKSHLVEMLAQEDMEDRIMQRGVRIVYVGQEYSNIHYLIRQRARRASSASVYHFPSNQIARKYTSHELDRIPREAFTLPPKAVVDALLAAYFKHVHPGFPVLDKAAFLGQYRRRDPLNPLSLLVLQAVLMVGAHVYREDDAENGAVEGLVQDRAALKAAFFRRAKMLFDARFEWNRDVVVQAALLMMWHSEGVEDIGANSYYWVGVAARTALGLGMHRDTRASTLIAHDKRLWRRLWWILVQLDGIVTLSYGRPPAIRLDESDVPELVMEELAGSDRREDQDDQNNRREDQDEDGDSGIDGEYLIHQMHLSCIVARTLRDRFGLQVSPDRRRLALVEADQRLAAWMARLPPSLRCRPDGRAVDANAAPMSPWTTMLHLTYNNFLILLHRPPPNPADVPGQQHQFQSSQSQENMGICSAAAGTIVSLLEAVAARDELRFLSVFAVDALLTTLIQLSAEIRMANPILAGHALQRFDSAMDILRRLAGIWLHAEIVLRLFEDRSAKVRAEMLLEKETTGNGNNVGTMGTGATATAQGLDVPPAYSPQALHHPPPVTPGSTTTTLPMDSFQSLLMSSTGLSQQGQQHHHHQQQQQFVPMNEQLDWTSLYWENGLASLSPFSDMPMYLSM
ncbi:hypothetical protein SBRCBS47491_003380 [Sporothrix bragantina]|uniref:Xylanolytic transcriptional activator regulatory domain-containing protein n=1 Tax=Sporothrix bragantina TaxID=671064 RepID=A0ABP0BEY4_9PEZI